MGVADGIQKLQSLRVSGALTEDEFSATKARLLFAAQEGNSSKADGGFTANGASVWAMYLDFSQLLGYVMPVMGLLTPIINWQVNNLQLDSHGTHVINWLILLAIYAIGAGATSVLLIGVPVLLVLDVAGIPFPIIA